MTIYLNKGNVHKWLFLIGTIKYCLNKSFTITALIVLLFLFCCGPIGQKPETYLNSGNSCMSKGQYDQAISYYDKALDTNPGYAEAFRKRGSAYSRKGQYDQAISDYSKAIEISPKFTVAYSNRAIAFREKRQYDQAISDYNKVLEITPEDAAAHNDLAWLLATVEVSGLRNGKRAVELALKACDLSEWKNPNYLDTLAAAYARLGDFGNATKWQEKALQLYEEGKEIEAQERLNLYREHRPWPSD